MGRNQGITTAGAVRIATVLVLITTAGCGGNGGLPADDPGRLTIRLKSQAFVDGGKIPRDFTCDGPDHSPPLEWSGVPETARSLALICDDPDAPMGTWSHWVLFNLSPEIKALPQGLAPEKAVTLGTEAKAQQGTNDFGRVGYGGPCPPRGVHHYYFRLYALDTVLNLDSRATRAQMLAGIRKHILAEGRLVGTYSR